MSSLLIKEIETYISPIEQRLLNLGPWLHGESGNPKILEADGVCMVICACTAISFFQGENASIFARENP